jgi:hypothetical protein
LLGASYAASAEILIKPVLIGERRSVNDGISPKTVRRTTAKRPSSMN